MTKITTVRNYINGEWIDPSGKDIRKGYNPADKREQVFSFTESTEEDTKYAIDSAAEAFKMWKKTTAPQRG